MPQLCKFENRHHAGRKQCFSNFLIVSSSWENCRARDLLALCSKFGTLISMTTKRSTKVNSNAPSPETSLFWDELAVEMLDPEFQREFELESLRIATIDNIIGALDAAREELAMSKADVARAIGGQGSVVRRLFSSDSISPTLTSITEVAAAVGMRIVAVPMDPQEQQRVLSVMSKAPTGAQSVPRAAPSRARAKQRAVPQKIASSTKAAAGRSATRASKTVAKKSVAAKKAAAKSVR